MHDNTRSLDDDGNGWGQVSMTVPKGKLEALTTELPVC